MKSNDSSEGGTPNAHLQKHYPPLVRPSVSTPFAILAIALLALAAFQLRAANEPTDEPPSSHPYHPVTDEDVARALEEAIAARDFLEEVFDENPQYEQDWKDYLLWDKVCRQTVEGRPVDVDAWQEALTQLTANYAGLELGCFSQLRQAIRHLVEVTAAQGRPDLQAETNVLLDDVAQALPPDGTPPSSANLEHLSDLLTRLARRQQASEVIEKVREDHLSPNLRIAVPQSVIGRALNSSVEQDYEYSTRIGGAAVSGTGTISAEVLASILVNDPAGAIQMRVEGTSLSTATSRENRVRVRTRDRFEFVSEGTIRLTAEGFQSGEFDTSGNLRSRIRGISTPHGGLLGQWAKNRARSSHACRLSQAKKVALRDLTDHISREVGAQCADLNAAFDEHVRIPLQRLDRYPPEVTSWNDESTTWISATVADERQLGAPPDVPAIGTEDSVRLFCHESVVRNTASAILASSTRSLAQMFRLLGDAETPADDEEEPLMMTFPEFAPIRVRFADDRIVVVLSVAEFGYAGNAYSGMDIRLTYALEGPDSERQLVRAGEPTTVPRLNPDGSRPRRSIRDTAFRRILLNRLERDFPAEIDISQVDLPAGLLPGDSLETLAVSISEGWFCVSAALDDS